MAIRESETKNRLCAQYFIEYDWTRTIGDIDLAICSKPLLLSSPITFLWCETKQGTKHNIYESLIQLILTIGKAKTYEREIPPYFLGAADAEKIAFVEYHEVMHIFSKSDFNWNVVPSDHSTKEFKELFTLLHDTLAQQIVIFKYAFDDSTLRKFIKKNFKEGRKSLAKIPVNKNNFTFVYYDWVKSVKSSIRIDWEEYASHGVLDCDFFLADLMSREDLTILEKLKVILDKNRYKINVDVSTIFKDLYKDVSFKDEMQSYHQFWQKYERPPKPVYQKYILDRRDLLVPQNIREVKGSYYTPEIWVRKAQEYIQMTLGEDWQDQYYIWDCAAGSGNLLRGLTNKYNIFASTIDDADVKIMHSAIRDDRLNLLENNVFQLDFLNDDFSKCPASLQNIIKNDPSHLVIFINPPFAEPTNAKTLTGTGKNRSNLYTTKTRERYEEEVGLAIKELFAQFLYRIYKEIPGCIIANFSTLKALQASNFKEFRSHFQARLKKMFIVPSYTFDNVGGNFPIGFHIWNTAETERFTEIFADTFNEKDEFLGEKHIICYDDKKLIIDWLREYYDKSGALIGYLKIMGTDIQHNRYIFIANYLSANEELKHIYTRITPDNLIQMCIYNACRSVVADTWENDRDLYTYPNDQWAYDAEFQVNCLIYSIFDCIIKQKSQLPNYWTPFYEYDVNSPGTFNNRFMADFLNGKVERFAPKLNDVNLFSTNEVEEAIKEAPIKTMSYEAKAVYDAGKVLWRYYMSMPDANPDASLYDIKGYFQGFDYDKRGKERMKPDSSDELYVEKMGRLKEAMVRLADKIEPKVYEYGFLR